MALTARAYREPADLRTKQLLAQEAWPLAGPLARWHVGDLAWGRFQHVGREREWPTMLWEEDGAVVAWGWVHLPGHLELLVHPQRPELLEEVLDWFETVAESAELTVSAVAEDRPMCSTLERRGYEAGADLPFFAFLERRLDDLPEPLLPEGYVVRSVVGAADLGSRVEVHRAAWAPSRVTNESYRNVMRAWPYRPELDCVVESADGSFAASALAWLDDANRVGELEPVGTHPAHRRRGLARAVCLFALHRLREVGATSACVRARGDEAYPLPKRIYESIGFRQRARSVEYRRAC